MGFAPPLMVDDESAVVEGYDMVLFWDTYIEEFQLMPYQSVDKWFARVPQGYCQFGSSLFALFLDDQYGVGDGALLAELWSHTPQDGTITGGSGEFATSDVDNEPDYLDAIDAGLTAHGASLDEAWVDFSAARWFIGENDDGAHITGAAAWTTGAPFVDSTWAAEDLPLVDQPATEDMAEYSSSFMVFQITPQPGMDLLLEIAGSEAIAWGGTALALKDDEAAVVLPLEMVDGAHGSVRVPLDEGLAEVVLSVAALSDGTHDPEDGDVSRDHGHRVSASIVEALPSADTGDTGDSAEGEGCGCASARSAWASLLPALLGLLGLGAMRRRA